MAEVKIGSARIDENGNAHGGRAGDQTGREVSTQNWYRHKKGWRVLRAKDPAAAEKIAQAMQWACDSKLIGYDQYQRETLRNAVMPLGWDIRRLNKAVETDCSALVRVCCGWAFQKDLGAGVSYFNTTSMCAALLKTGLFTELTGAKYTDSSDYLRRGDILCTKTQGHTVVVLSDGGKAGAEQGTGDREQGTAPARGGAAVRITGGSVNLRSAPGKGFMVLGVASRGDVLVYQQESHDVNGTPWHRVAWKGSFAWVSGKYSEVIAA